MADIFARRDALHLIGLASAAAVGSTAAAPTAHAEFTYAPDVVLFCNPSLAAPLRRLGDLFRVETGVSVRIIATADRIFAAQIARGERNDVCITLASVAGAMASAGLVDPQPTVGFWRDRLVIARAGDGAPPVDPRRLPVSARLGVTDATDNAIVDSQALLDALGLEQTRVGEIDTARVATLLARHAVDLGLIFTTDQRAGPFTVAATIPDEAYPPVRYAAVLNKHVLSRYASPFLDFLATQTARARLIESGLEIQT